MTEITIEGAGKNALGTAQMTHLLDALRAADGAPVLITGAGDAFSAGLNLKEVVEADLETMNGFLTTLTELLATLFHYPGPTVAAVNGHAIAGGALVAMFCDIRVCTDNPRARIGLNEVAIGLRFPPRILRLARSRLAPSHETEVLLGAGLHGPLDAQRLGLVDHVVPDVMDSARKTLKTLASYPPEIYAAGKRDLREAVDAPVPGEDARFREDVLPVWTGDALKTRIRGFLGR